MTEDKRVRWSWEYLQAISETENLYILTEREIQALLTPLAVSSWRTRWLDLPANFDEIDTFFATIQEKLLTPMDICQLIAECIDGGNLDDTLKGWIRDNDGGGGGNPTLPIVYNRPNVGGGGSPTLWSDSCDNDNLFAMVTGIVDLVHTTIVDLAQLIETSTNSGELFANAISAIPVLGELPYSDIYQFIDNFLSNVGESYDAQYTEIIRTLYRCNLYCLAIDNCAISFEDFADYFANRVSTAIANVNWLDVAGFLSSGTWSGALIVDAAHYMVFSALAYGSNVLNVNMPFMTRIALSLMNDSNNDWATLCNGCVNPFSLVMDFPSCGSNGYGIGSGLTNLGASPLNAAWTRYSFAPSTNIPAWSGSGGSHPSGCRIKESEGRQFKIQSAGRSAGTGSVIGGKCVNGSSYANVNWSFNSTNINETIYGFYYACSNNAMTLYIDVQWI